MEAHDCEAIEPQSDNVKACLRYVPPDIVAESIGNVLHLVRFAGNNALVLMQGPSVLVQLEHLVLMRLLDGKDVVPELVEECRQLLRAAAGVPTREQQAPDGLCVGQALQSR